MKKINRCIDCKKEIDFRAKRCKSCARQGRLHPMFGIHRFGKEAPNWKGGFPRCTKCKSKLSRREARLCQNCYSDTLKGVGNPMFGVHRFGIQSPTWMGGISFEPYTPEFNYQLKEQIRKRDNCKCQLCNKKQIIRKLDVHHIDYNKKNNKEENLITLCCKCNLKVNYNRDYWYAYFTYIMENNK
jgi:hypothetical protein